MRRFFVPPGDLTGEEVALSGETLHHLGVLRLSVGEEVLLLDGRGTLCRCRIESLDRRSAQARVLSRWREEESAFPVRLLQALPKGDKMDLILQKGTELGITAFTPVLAGRSVARPAPGQEENRLARWERIVRAAARQCRRPRLPRVMPPLSLAGALDGCEADLRLMLWEAESRPLADVLPEEPPRDAAILVGPEGGFSPQEAETARKLGFIPVHIGPRILRTETAGFAVAAILQYLYGDLGAAEADLPRKDLS